MKHLIGATFLGCTLLAMSANAQEVSCENVAGQCKVSQSTTECQCKNGDGMGSSSGYDPDGPQPDPKTEAELLAECESLLVDNCGDTVPDVDEHCTEDQLTLCTSYLETMEELDQNCDFGGGDVSTTDSSTDSTTDAEPEPDEGEVPAGSTLLPPTVPDNPWIISRCCDELDADLEGSLRQAFDCLATIKTTDCEEAEACLEEAGLGTNTSSSKDDQDGSDGESSTRPDGENLDETDSADDADEAADGGSETCQVSAALGQSSFSFLALLAAVL